MPRCFSLIFLMGVVGFAHSQSFQNSSTAWGVQVYNNGPLYGSGVSFCDFNGDGKDDLTFCINGDSIYFFQNTGTNFTKIKILPNAADAKQPTWVDYDNDGDKDLFITKKGAPSKLYRNDGFPAFTDVSVSMNLPVVLNYDTYGCSWGDYDNDGYLDVYICNYNWLDGVNNWLMHNNGNGTFTNTATLLGVDNGSKPTFQSTWIDYNFDGWLDLYIVNDKFQGNVLYMNNGNGTFTNAGAAGGANVGLDSMCNSISDMDNDGDFDIYISNTASTGNYLLRNDDGVFVNVAETAGVEANMLSWGGLWIDYNNDGWDDLHSANVDVQNGNQNLFFINQHDGTFVESSSLVGLASDDFNSYANAKGDVDNNGYYDFIETHVGSTNQLLWKSVGGNNKWVKIGLEGVVSNRDGVGTLIEYWIGGNRRMRQTQCGGNYISQDSQYEIFGMGSASNIDSLFLKWPSGWVDVYYNVEGSQFLEFVEGATFSTSIQFDGTGLCPNTTAILSTGEFEEYLWSTGDTTQQITIDNPGTYWVEVSSSPGLTATAEITIPELNASDAIVSSTPPSCSNSEDGTISVSLTDGIISSIAWSNGSTEPALVNIPQGMYEYSLQDQNGCIGEGTVELTAPGPILVTAITAPPSCFQGNDGSVELEISGGTGEYSIDWMGLDPGNMPAGGFIVSVTDENLCQIDVEFGLGQPEPLSAEFLVATPCFGEPGSVGVEITGGQGGYALDWIGVDSTAVFAGSYMLTITDMNGCTAEMAYSINENPEITATVQQVNANAGNNGSSLVTASGGTPPYDYEWTTGSQSQVASNLGQGTYTCTITDDVGCTLDVEVNIIDLGISTIDSGSIQVYPNPAHDYIHAWCSSEELLLYSMDGVLLRKYSVRNGYQLVDIRGIAPGTYLLRSGIGASLLEVN